MNTLWSPFGLESLARCSNHAGVSCVEGSPPSIGYNQRKSCSRRSVSPSFFFGLRWFPDQYSVVVEEMFSEKFQHFFLHGFLHFCIWHTGSTGGVVPGRWSNLLLSDRDERNEIVGRARDGLVNVGFPPGCQEYECANSSHHRPGDSTEGESSTNYVEASAELLDVDLRLFCGTGDATRGLDLQVAFWSPVWFLLSCGDEDFPPSCAKKHHRRQYTSCPLFDIMLGLGLDVLASSIGE